VGESSVAVRAKLNRSFRLELLQSRVKALQGHAELHSHLAGAKGATPLEKIEDFVSEIGRTCKSALCHNVTSLLVYGLGPAELQGLSA
jgi:hypothetical protein